MKTSSLIQLILGVFIGLFRFSIYFWEISVNYVDFLQYLEFFELDEFLRVFNLIIGIVIIFIGLFNKNHVMRFIYSIFAAVLLIISLYFLLDFITDIPRWMQFTQLALLQIINFTVIVSLSLMVGLAFVNKSTTVDIIKIISWIPIFFGVIYFSYLIYLYTVEYQIELRLIEYLSVFDFTTGYLLVIPISLISYHLPKQQSLAQEDSYHTLQINDTKYCQKCGTPTNMDTIICSNCNTIFPKLRSQYESSNNSVLYGLLGFCIPILGLILYITLKDSQPENAKSSGIGALVSTGISFVVFIIYALVVFALLV